MKRKLLTLLFLFSAVMTILAADDTVKTEPATNVTQTRATLSAIFAEGSTQNGFQFKYGELPELNELAQFVLAQGSEPVAFTQNDKPWSIRSGRGYLESYSDRYSTSLNSTLQTVVTLSEPTTLTFEWSVNSEENIGILRFLLDSQNTDYYITGQVAFETVNITIPAGTHTLAWSYQRNQAENSGLGIGFLKNICIQNTTIGVWTDSITNSPTLRLERLYPQKSYLYRAFSQIGDKRLYGSIQQFYTDSISLGIPLLTDTMQASVGLTASAKIGDADVNTGFIVKQYDIRKPEDDFAWNLLDKTSDAISITTDGVWEASSGNTQGCGVYAFTNAQSDNNKSFSTTFTLTETTTIEFYYYCKNGYIKFYHDGTTHNLSSSNGTWYKGTYSPGSHTLKWSIYKNSSSYSTYYNAVVSYLKVTNTTSKYQITKTDSIAATFTDGMISARAIGLVPNTKYDVTAYMKPAYTALLEGTWPQNDTEAVPFTTKNVEAKTLDVINRRQASATLRGLVHGGDANIIARGLQYRIVSGTRWNNVKTTMTGDTLQGNVSFLNPATEYCYRSYIQAEGCDTVFSDMNYFFTDTVRAVKPVVVSKTQHTATLRIKSGAGDAYVYASGVMFRKQGDSEWQETQIDPDAESFILEKKNLEVATDYEVRSYVQPAGSDTIFSDVLAFKTKNIELVVDSVTAYQTKAMVYGRILAGDDAASNCKVEVYQGYASQFTSDYKVSEAIVTTTDSHFSVLIDGLTPDNSYIVIAKATNSSGGIVQSQVFTNRKYYYLTEAYTPSLYISDENWSTKRDYVSNGSYSQSMNTYYTTRDNSELSVKFELNDSATVSFNYQVKGSAYNYNTYDYDYNSIHMAVDSIPTETFISKGSGAGIYTMQMAPGKHTITWITDSISPTNQAYIARLTFNPLTAVNQDYKVGSQFSTPDYFNGVYQKEQWQISQTKATVSYRLSRRLDEQVDFRINLFGGYEYMLPNPNNDRSFPGTVKDSVVTFQLDGLCAGISYYLRPYAVVNGKEYYDNSEERIVTLGFLTGNEKIWYCYAKDVTQTSATMTSTIMPNHEPFENPYYLVWPVEGGDTIRLAATEEVERIDPDTVTAGFEREPNRYLVAKVNNLLPGKRYAFTYELTANGITYHDQSYYSIYYNDHYFNTNSAIREIREIETTQTTATFSVTLDESEVSARNLKMWIGDREFTYGNGVYTIDNLMPGNSYTIRLTYDVNGHAYDEQRNTFYTKWIEYAFSLDSICQTACRFHLEADLGTATPDRRLVYIEGLDTLSVGKDWIVSGLKPDTAYWMTPILTFKEGKEIKGNMVIVNTKPLSLTTLKPTNISNRSATLNGIIDCDDLSSAEFGFQWKEKTGWTTEPRFTKGRKLVGSDSISVALVNGMLKPDTEYEYRTAVRYKDSIYYAEQWYDLRTELEYVFYPATCYTLFRTDSENNCLVLCGYYIAGSESIISQGYEYWLNSGSNASRRTSDKNVLLTDSTMVGRLELGSLADGIYSLRAFITSESGTIYGQTLSFKVGNNLSGIDDTDTPDVMIYADHRNIVVKNAQGQHLVIVDLNGRQFYNGKPQQEEVIPVTKGIYVVRLSNGTARKLQVR